jgi:N-acetylglutamate synthase-like GNAT family acetyltransferase
MQYHPRCTRFSDSYRTVPPINIEPGSVNLASVKFCENGSAAPERINALFRAVGWTGMNRFAVATPETRAGVAISAWVHSDLIGYLFLDCRDKLATVQDCVVHPNCQGVGIGSSLIQRAIQIATTLGIESVQLTAWDGDPRLPEFYQRFGFKLTEKRTGNARMMIRDAH